MKKVMLESMGGKDKSQQ